MSGGHVLTRRRWEVLLPLAVLALGAASAALSTPLAESNDHGSTHEAAARKAHKCGTINIPDSPRDGRVLAHKVRCKQARRVAKYAIGNGPQPKNWICSASIGKCWKGDIGNRRWVKVKWK